MDQIPFPEEHQLNNQLRLNRSKTPAELFCTNGNSVTLPGQPRVQLDPSELDSYLRIELSVPLLNKIAPKLWLVSTPRSSHISSLHHQAVRGRIITLTENPQLHLVWYYNKIFIKPIPRYLLSHAFWQYLVTQPAPVQKAAVGFMRTYSYLVRYETDFYLAREKGLIPRNEPSNGEENHITWDTFARLISSFDKFSDESVSPRYSYGELRLTRLNFYSRIFLRKLTFHHMDAQWGTFLNGAIAPFIAIFVIISVILNAMQVELAAQGVPNIGSKWAAFANVSKWVSVFILVFTSLVMTFMVLLVTVLFFHDFWFARDIVKRKKDPHDVTWRSRKSGVV